MTIYLTNAASVAAVQRATRAGKRAKPETAACVGPGPVFSIMRYPSAARAEVGDGRVLRLTPWGPLALSAIGAKISAAETGDPFDLEMWTRFEASLRGRWLEPEHLRQCAPGTLMSAVRCRDGGGAAMKWDGDWWTAGSVVPDGATLICACSREAAGSGRCHRVIAADVLRVAGWSVVLDGREVRA